MDLPTIVFAVLKLALAFVPFALVPLMILMERRGAALIQDRPGPQRAAIPLPGGLRIRGFGMVHNVTDGVKLFFKESLVPPFVNTWFYILAPTIPVITAVLTPSLIPWFAPVAYPVGEGFGRSAGAWLDANSGILAMFALGSLSVYGVVLGAWASNSKYSLLGGMRASAMMVSYEVSMGLSVLGLLLLVGSFSLAEVVSWQQQHAWGFIVQPVGCLLFLVSMFAETNRNPFDVAEGESEIVAGFHTEYTSVKFALFFMGEYCHIVIASALIATLYFGGFDLWFFDLSLGGMLSFMPQGPYDQQFILAHLGGVLALVLAFKGLLFLGFSWLIGLHAKRYAKLAASDAPAMRKEYGFFRAGCAVLGLVLLGLAVWSWTSLDPKPVATLDQEEVYGLAPTVFAALIQAGTLMAKTLFFCWLFVWVRWTLPRFRYDQIMSLGWKWMLNIAVINLLVTAIVAKIVRG